MFLGMAKFNELAPKLMLGERSPALLEGRVSSYMRLHQVTITSCDGSIYNVLHKRERERPPRCTLFRINLFQLNYHLHVSNK